MSINLQDFCYKGEEYFRKSLTKPFTIGDRTYATNGVIAVRVPKISEIEDSEPNQFGKVIDIEGCFNDFFNTDGLRDMVYGGLPECVITTIPSKVMECKTCDGNGECPHCGGECGECDGTGNTVSPARTENSDEDKYVELGGAVFTLKNMRLLQSLTGVKVKKRAHVSHPMPFTFDGGDGLIMPATRDYISSDLIVEVVV